MAFTPYANEIFLNWALTYHLAVPRPTAWYVAWHIGSPGDDGSTNEQTVSNDADYARQAITVGAAEWSSVLKKSISRNTNTITIAPAAGVSYDILGFSIWDSLTGGNCLLSAPSQAVIPVSDIAPLSLIAGKVPIILSTGNAATGFTSYGGNLVLDWLLTAAAVTRPTAWFWGLATADPGDDGTANEVTVGDDPDYVRKETTFSPAATITGSDSYARTATDSIWTPGAGANFTAPYGSVFDASTGGNAILVSTFAPSKIGIAAQTLSISANEVTVAARV
jgi:hypothetical protein